MQVGSLARSSRFRETLYLVTPSLGSPTLVLVPTDLERKRLIDQGGFEPGSGLVSLCGFGPIAAAARTTQLLHQLTPARVLLVGIAGAFDTSTHPVGSAHEFTAVSVAGVGVGEGERFQGPPALGFPQWPGSPGTTPQPILDRIELAPGKDATGGVLLTTCAASDSPEHAQIRRANHPQATCEDMEGFAVALACSLARTPLRIVRGVSNEVGDRDASQWRIPGALGAARELARTILASNEGWERSDAGAEGSDS